MCDSILAMPQETDERIMLFGKNSDRQRNEAQTVEYFPGADYGPGAQISCQFLTVPQVRHTHAVLLCRPFWMWGGEMGANEHGVVIGNEAVHARSRAPEDKALTGNDLIRLSLERAQTAAEAVEVITALLEQYGQGGDCGHLTPSFYNNGFMIADPTQAYVLETVGREWLLERVRGVHTISNRYSIDRAERVSSGLNALIRDRGWSNDPEPCYADVLADPHREHIGNAGARRECSTSLLRARNGQVTTADMMSILRDHGAGGSYHPQWREECTTTRTVCMHAGAGDRTGQTAGSMVSELHDSGAVHWVTGTAAPCVSIFKPVLFDVPLPPQGPRLTDRFDPGALWWRHERLHRAALLRDFGKFIEGIREERDALEAEFRASVKAVLVNGSIADREEIIAHCWTQAWAMEDRWLEGLSRIPLAPVDAAYRAEWLQMNQIAGLS